MVPYVHSTSQIPESQILDPRFFCGTLRPIVGRKMLVAARILSLNTPHSNKNGFRGPNIHYPDAQNNTPKNPPMPQKTPQIAQKCPENPPGNPPQNAPDAPKKPPKLMKTPLA